VTDDDRDRQGRARVRQRCRHVLADDFLVVVVDGQRAEQQHEAVQRYLRDREEHERDAEARQVAAAERAGYQDARRDQVARRRDAGCDVAAGDLGVELRAKEGAHPEACDDRADGDAGCSEGADPKRVLREVVAVAAVGHRGRSDQEDARDVPDLEHRAGGVALLQVAPQRLPGSHQLLHDHVQREEADRGEGAEGEREERSGHRAKRYGKGGSCGKQPGRRAIGCRGRGGW
jgi:hypothetical protein